MESVEGQDLTKTDPQERHVESQELSSTPTPNLQIWDLPMKVQRKIWQEVMNPPGSITIWRIRHNPVTHLIKGIREDYDPSLGLTGAQPRFLIKESIDFSPFYVSKEFYYHARTAFFIFSCFTFRRPDDVYDFLMCCPKHVKEQIQKIDLYHTLTPLPDPLVPLLLCSSLRRLDVRIHPLAKIMHREHRECIWDLDGSIGLRMRVELLNVGWPTTRRSGAPVQVYTVQNRCDDLDRQAQVEEAVEVADGELVSAQAEIDAVNGQDDVDLEGKVLVNAEHAAKDAGTSMNRIDTQFRIVGGSDGEEVPHGAVGAYLAKMIHDRDQQIQDELPADAEAIEMGDVEFSQDEWSTDEDEKQFFAQAEIDRREAAEAKLNPKAPSPQVTGRVRTPPSDFDEFEFLCISPQYLQGTSSGRERTDSERDTSNDEQTSPREETASENDGDGDEEMPDAEDSATDHNSSNDEASTSEEDVSVQNQSGDEDAVGEEEPLFGHDAGDEESDEGMSDEETSGDEDMSDGEGSEYVQDSDDSNDSDEL